MCMNKRGHKNLFVFMAVFMITMIMILTFSQQAVEIYAYGFIARNIDKNIKADQKMLTTSIVYKNETTNVNNFVLKKPVKGGITTSGFGDMVSRKASHKGHDWAVDIGTRVRAAGDGVVEMAYYSESYGYNILINHNNGFKTRYAHLSKLKVSKGERVKQNQLIGLSGSTGYSTGPHLHFEVEKDGKRVNPLKYVRSR